MVTGTTSPSTRYERISVSPASCSIKSEYVIASHAFKPQYKCINYTPAWEQRKLGEFSKKNTIKNANGALSETFTNSAEQGVISQLDYFDHDITNDANISGYYVVQPDDFVYNPRISATAPCGPINRNCLNRAGVMSPLYTVFSVDASMDKTYLEHYFKTSRWHDFMFLEGNTGARSDRFSISDATFFEMPIWCPEISEQMAIAKQLETTDTLITLHQRKYDKLVIFKKSMLEKMFPKDGESVPEIRFAGFTDPWEQRKFGDVADIKTGPFGTLLHAEDYVDDGIPIVTTEHFKTGALPKDKEGIPQVSEEDAKRLEQYRAKEGDILFSRVGSVDANAQVFAGQDGWLFSGRVLRARPDLTLVSSAYLHYELETEEVKSSVISRAVGGTMASINTEILFQTPIFIPAKMTEQNKIGSTCARLDSLITLHQRKLELLQNIKKSLLDKMFV